jgi:hypothetical protein
MATLLLLDPQKTIVMASQYPQSGHLLWANQLAEKNFFTSQQAAREVKDYLGRFYHNGSNPTKSIVTKLTMLSIT